MYDYIDYTLAVPTAIALWAIWFLVKRHEARKARKANNVSGK